MQNTQNKNKLGLILGCIVVGIMVLMLIVIFKDDFQKKPTSNVPTTSTSTGKKFPANSIVRVGNEYLYQKDLDTEIQYSPPMKNVDKNKFFLDKMIRDSIILQGASEDKLITLDDSVFNSPNKSYTKRTKLALDAEKAVTGKSKSISGTIITIWFLNGNMPGLLGYDKSKEVAYQKISALYDQVKDKKITIQQALEINRKDETRHDLDSSWKMNPGLTFSAAEGETITFDKAFDNKIRALNKGEMTEVTALKEVTKVIGNGQPVDVLYAFAEVSDKKTDSLKPFDEWLKEKQQKYGVSYE
jgi:hypothetical protein